MATTEDRLHEVEELEELYRRSSDLESPPRDSLNVWCRRLLIGWMVVFGSIVLFEPAPTNPDAAVPAWGTVLVTAFTAALAAAAIGLSRRRPWALRASVAAGSLGIAVGAACMLTDHHMGFWGRVRDRCLLRPCGRQLDRDQDGRVVKLWLRVQKQAP